MSWVGDLFMSMNLPLDSNHLPLGCNSCLPPCGASWDHPIYIAYQWVMLNGMNKLTKSNLEKQSYLCEPVNKLVCSHFDYYFYLPYIPFVIT